VIGAQPGSIFTMKVFVEQNQITPMGIFLKNF